MQTLLTPALVFLLCGLAVTRDNRPSPSSDSSQLLATASAVSGLTASGYRVVRGSVFLFQNTDCPQFIDIFGSCFGNNAAAPYVIPQPPTEGTYVDPYYGTPLNADGPDGVNTNITYRLSDYDALITVVAFPPTGAYFGYQSYVFTGDKRNYATTDPLQVVSPNPSRYEIFGSVGNDVNNIVVQNQYDSPWRGRVVTYVTTSNQALAKDLVLQLAIRGVDPSSVFVEPLGANVRTGTGSSADDLVTLMRYALPRSPSAAAAWYAAVSSNVLVYKVTAPNWTVTRYPESQYTPRTGHAETTLLPALDELAGLLQAWSTANSTLGRLSAVTTSTFTATSVDVGGIPHGLVGGDCIRKGTMCAGDNQDTSTYAFSPKFALSDSSILFVAGVDHNQFSNSSYISLSIYDASQMAGIASSSQANVSAVGFNSGTLTGSESEMSSAQYVVRALGLYNSASDTLKRALPGLYVTLVSKTCSVAKRYCVDLAGDSLIPDTVPPTPINMYERSYIRPGDTTGATSTGMVFPRIIGPGRQ